VTGLVVQLQETHCVSASQEKFPLPHPAGIGEQVC
jgi:hypothetical protein